MENVIVLAKNMNKIRPLIIAVSSVSKAKYFFAITHLKKDRNTRLTPEGVFGLKIDNKTYFAQTNIPTNILRQIGYITQEKADEMISHTSEKSRRKTEKKQSDLITQLSNRTDV